MIKQKKEYANDITDHTETDYIVETLLNEGTILPPCKVGDVVYTIFEGTIVKLNVIEGKTVENIDGVYSFYDAGNRFLKMPFSERLIGKTVFLTKEEAEQKLKELKSNA